jgi:hypothetical protein
VTVVVGHTTRAPGTILTAFIYNFDHSRHISNALLLEQLILSVPPFGPRGNTGKEGPAGRDGAPGEPGPPGRPGSAGAQGAPGGPGNDGAPGATGAAGFRRTIFAFNQDGDDGPQGFPGRRGFQGAAGAPGTNGPPGLRRTIIALGNDGDDGPPGMPVVKRIRVSSISFAVNGFGTVLPTGVIGYLQIPFNFTIVGWTLLANVSGSVVVDIWKDTYANYPPVVADTITAAAKPTITTALKATSTTLTGWTVSALKGDVLGFNIDSVTSITMLTINLDVLRSIT